ncbi:hypothetical protein LIER_33377 [Lithospermum erythrorhizon]|uniref:Transposase MuDR plant domain-containing protein n=1 Tax=Lithospermum erythrorhizon TaxID=34254 RepID=A0AAV3RYR4_LITER
MASSSLQPKKKFIGPYARHGLGFKERNASEYKESSSDEEKDNHVLSESDSNYTLRSIATSSEEEASKIQQRKNVRYVQFNEKDMKDLRLFSGLVFSSKEQVTEAVTWYSIFHHKPLWRGANDNCRLSVKCDYPCNFSIWFAKDYMLGEIDWSVRR